MSFGNSLKSICRPYAIFCRSLAEIPQKGDIVVYRPVTRREIADA